MSNQNNQNTPVIDLRPHGTLAAYRRHLRRNERACERCLFANALAAQQFRRIHPQPYNPRKR